MGDGSVPVGRGVVPGQVAEIIVALAGEPGRRGSGYRVGPGAVLTAAHVVEGAAAVRVRFDADLPGEWTAEVISCWVDSRSDLAVLTLAPRGAEPAVAVARFGRIGGDRAAVLAARAVGFPRFKRRRGPAPVPRFASGRWVSGGVVQPPRRHPGTHRPATGARSRSRGVPVGGHVRRRGLGRRPHRRRDRQTPPLRRSGPPGRRPPGPRSCGA
ncbi:MAG: trypsin-like peptidase domain-containing protein [Pseudonocardiaceae bacterium]